jgi:hypothetical protein
MYYMWINKNFVHQVGDQTKVILRCPVNQQSRCSETLQYKIQMPGNYPEESIQHSKHSKTLKSRIKCFFLKI